MRRKKIEYKMPLTRSQQRASSVQANASTCTNHTSASTSANVSKRHRAPLGDVSNKRKFDENANHKAKTSAGVLPKKVKTSSTSIVQRVRAAVRNKNAGVRRKKESVVVKGRRRSPRLSGEHMIASASSSTDRINFNDDADSSSNQSSIFSAAKDVIEVVEVDDPNLIVQKRFRLARDNFDGLSQTLGVAAHDEDKVKDELMVAQYLTDVYQNLYFEETMLRPGLYMHQQQDINAKMRSILVDWLVEVHMKFRLVPETLYLCIAIIDRYCVKVTNIRRSKLQLVGVTALLIACKYEEIYPPEVRDCVYITDRAYDRQHVILMEQDILNKLDWKITVPTPYPFLVRFLELCKASDTQSTAANYFLERTLQEHDLLRFRGSVIAASCTVLAINCDHVYKHEHQKDRDTREPGFPPILMEYTNFNEQELRLCISLIRRKVSEEPVTMSNRQLIAVKRKYDQEKYKNISALPTPNDQICCDNV